MIADHLLRGALGAAIRFYRQRLSGRWPLLGVRCTFSHLESCSAFGERMAREASSPWVALDRIVRRLVRCRELSLFRLADGALGWGRGYEVLVRATTRTYAVHGLEERLAAQGENAAVRAAVRQATTSVFAAAGVTSGGARPQARVAALLVRDAVAVRRGATRRLRSRTVVASTALVLAGVVGAAGFGAMAVAPLLLTCVLSTASIVASVRLLQMLERLEILAAVEGPCQRQQWQPETSLAGRGYAWSEPAGRSR